MDFKIVPKKYRPIPFWSWNEKLNTSETSEQVRKMNNVGIGGFFMHARGGLQTEYLSEEWFDNIEAAISAGEETGMSAWAYDENGWPSGFGNGYVNGKGIEYQQKYLRMSETEHEENFIAKCGNHWFYFEVNPFYVDVLDKRVAAEFIDYAYKPYYEKYGHRIAGFFTDEPQISRKGIPWSFVYDDEYKSRYGQNIKEHLCEFYGLEKGNNQHTTDERIGNNFRTTIGEFSTRRELVEAFGLIERTANNYQSLAKNSGEELEEAVLSGKIKPTNAISISRLPKEQQKEVVAFVEENGKVSGAKIEEKIKTLKEESQSDEKIKGSIGSKQFKDTVKQNEEKIQSEETNEDIVTFDDIEMYFKYGDGSDYEKSNIQILKDYINNPYNAIPFLNELNAEHIAEQLTCYINKFKNKTLSLSDVEVIKEFAEEYIDYLSTTLDNFKSILAGAKALGDSIERILDYADEETVPVCDDEGFLYNEVGKR